MLENLVLENFKRHSKLNAAFGPGMTSIIGPNAAGKSSILKGVLMAMFGNKAAGDSSCLWNLRADTPGKSVGLRLTLPTYGVVTLTRTPSGAKLLNEKGAVLASGASAVTKMVEDTLGMSIKDLKTLCYSPQGETQGILTMGPSVLQKKIEDLSKMELLDKVLASISKDLLRLEGVMEGLPKVDGLDELKARHTESLELVGNYEASHQRAVADLALRKSEVNQAWEALEAVREWTKTEAQLGRKYAGLDQQWQGSLARCKELERQLTEIPEDSADKAEQMAALCQQAESEIAKLRNSIRARDSAIKKRQRKADLYPVVAKSQEAEESLQTFEPRLKDAKERNYKAELDTVQAKKDAAKLKVTLEAGTCKTCKQSLNTCDLEHIKKELAEADGMVIKCQEEQEDAAKTLSDLLATVLSFQHRVNKGAEAELKELELEDLEPALARTVEDLQQALSAADEASQMHNRQRELLSRQAGQLALLTRQLTQAKDETTSAHLEATKVKVQLSAHRETCPEYSEEVSAARYQQATTVRDQAQQLETSLAQQLWEINSQVGQLSAKIAELEEAKAKAEETHKEVYEISSLQTFLRKNRSRFATELWDGLLQHASALITNTTGGRLSGLTRSTSGEFSITEDGIVMPVAESSGAQKSIIGLALRASMVQVFFGKGLFLLLDEPTSDATPETSAAVAGMLKSLNMQVVVVSHNLYGDATTADSVIEVSL